jgi:hypothetical protein
MAGIRLDSTGQIKMKTLDDALLLLQRINGLVEQYGMAMKRNQPTGPFVQNIRRTLPSLAENLKGQFGMISDQVIAINLNASRGASEVVRLRQLREGVAQIKQALEIAFTQTKDKHSVKEDSHDKTSDKTTDEADGSKRT